MLFRDSDKVADKDEDGHEKHKAAKKGKNGLRGRSIRTQIFTPVHHFEAGQGLEAGQGV